MKKVIYKKMYNTDTAELIGEYDNGLHENDFRSVWEGLYITKKGAYFIAGNGGALSIYAESNGEGSWGGEDIRVIDEDQALQFCAKHDLIESIEKHFSGMIEEG